MSRIRTDCLSNYKCFRQILQQRTSKHGIVLEALTRGRGSTTGKTGVHEESLHKTAPLSAARSKNSRVSELQSNLHCQEGQCRGSAEKKPRRLHTYILLNKFNSVTMHHSEVQVFRTQSSYVLVFTTKPCGASMPDWCSHKRTLFDHVSTNGINWFKTKCFPKMKKMPLTSFPIQFLCVLDLHLCALLRGWPDLPFASCKRLKSSGSLKLHGRPCSS